MSNTIPLIGPVPALGLGTWRLSGATCTASVKKALELGYRHIDTADVYKNHQEIAVGIKDFPRDQLFITSKIAEQNLPPQNVLPTCKRFLQELQTTYLDLLLIHWPSDNTPSEDTLNAMIKLKESGLIRNIGVSNFMVTDLDPLEQFGFPILANQIELHPYLQEERLVEYCQSKGIIIVAYRPIQRAGVKEDPLLIRLGQKYDKSPVQITLRWIYQRNIVTIPKATSEEHLRENIEIFDFSLSEEDMKAIATLEANRRYVV